MKKNKTARTHKTDAEPDLTASTRCWQVSITEALVLTVACNVVAPPKVIKLANRVKSRGTLCRG